MPFHLVRVRLPLFVLHPPKISDPEIEDKSGFLFRSVLVLAARDTDSWRMPPALQTVLRSCSDRFPVAPKRSLPQALSPGLAARAIGSGTWMNGDGFVDWIPPSLVVKSLGWTLFLPSLTTGLLNPMADGK
jgi:hypothetical protein